MKTNAAILVLFFLTPLSGCNTDNRIQQSQALKQEMEGTKIKRVTDAQLMAVVSDWGKQVVAKARMGLEKELNEHPDEASRLCLNLDHVPLIAALDRQYGSRTQLLGLADLQNTTLAPKERELLDAFLYNAENELPQTDNVQLLNDTLLVYNAPVPPGSVICTACFADQKVPFAVWRVLIDKKGAIQQLDTKKLAE